MNKAVQAGLVAGYLNTCVQLTDGYGLKLRVMRESWKMACDKVADHYEQFAQSTDDNRKRCVAVGKKAQAQSLKNLAVCGWCLAPFITFPVWFLMARKTGLRGYLTAVGVCAFTRHIAEMY